MNKQYNPSPRRPSTPGCPATARTRDLSVAAQLRALRDFAKNNGYSIAREYVEKAESGRIADRPQSAR